MLINQISNRAIISYWNSNVGDKVPGRSVPIAMPLNAHNHSITVVTSKLRRSTSIMSKVQRTLFARASEDPLYGGG